MTIPCEDMQNAAQQPFMQRIQLITTLVVCMGFLLAPAGCTPNISDRDVKTVSVDQALKEMGTRRGLLGMSGKISSAWVDARNRAAYDSEHIPDAMSLPFSELERRHRQLEDIEVIVVYGEDYADPVAKAMSKRLKALGYHGVLTLNGGLRAWKDAGNETAPMANPG